MFRFCYKCRGFTETVKIGGWGEESATGKSVSVSFRVRVVRAVRASGRGEAA